MPHISTIALCSDLFVVIFSRKWNVNSGISPDTMGAYYYLDPGTQEITQICLNAVQAKTFLMLHAARASGKTTRLLWLANELQGMGYRVV